MIGFALSVGLNVFQFYTMEYVEEIYFQQCGSSIISIRESELNAMFDKLEGIGPITNIIPIDEGSEK